MRRIAIRPRLSISLLGFWVATLAPAGSAQTALDRLSIRHWDDSNGVPEESVYGVSETPDGYIWLATRDRLVRFDGRNFQAIDPAANDLSRDTGIGAITWDGRRFWVGARDYLAFAEVDQFQSLTNARFSTHRFPRRGGDRWGVADLQTAAGRLWIRRSEGIYQLPLANLERGAAPEPQLAVAAPPGDRITAMRVDSSGLAFYATEAGLWAKSPTGAWQLLPASPGSLVDILPTRHQGIWGFGLDFAYRDGPTWQRISWLRSNALETHRAMLEDRGGAIWIGAQNGVWRVAQGRPEFLSFAHRIRRDDFVISLMQARDGSIWCGTRWGSLVHIEEPRFPVLDTAAGLDSSAVAAVQEDDLGRIWIGSRTRGVYLRDGLHLRPVPATGNRILHAMRPLPGGRMLLADTGGLWVSDGGQPSLLLPRPQKWDPSRYQAISTIENGVLYYGDSSQVHRLRLRGNGFEIDEGIAPMPVLRALIPDGPSLWGLSWETGLLEWRDGRLKTHGLGPGTQERRGMTAYELSPDWFLVGTSSGALLFDRKARRYAPVAEICPGEPVFGFQHDGRGHLWILGRRGLLVANRKRVLDYAQGRAERPTPLRFTASQGLASGNFGLGTSSLSTLSRSGELWLASMSGAIHFDPLAALRTRQEARAAVDGLLADGVPIPVNRSIELPAGTRRVGVHFTTVGLHTDLSPTFRYLLRGIDSEPVETHGQEAIFNNLGPGAYRFELQTRLADTGWDSNQSAVLEFRIAPFWYQRPYIPYAGVVLTALALAIAWWIRARRSRRRTAELEAKVQERTEALRHALESRSQFLAAMSHEIRTPMNGVLGMVQLLEDEVQDPAQRGKLAILRASGETLRQVVNDILDLSKIESGAMPLERVSYSIRDLATQCAALFEPQVREKGLDLSLSIADDVPPWLLGDPSRVRQILVNLLNNAVKFTAHGRIELRIARVGDRLLCTVLDTGIGIASDQLTRIFEPFTQAETSTTRRFGGTGLGLTICARLVSAMQGSIRVDSQPGAGSRFEIDLPLEEGSPVREAGPEPSRTAPAPSLAVLLVEDHRVNRLVARAMLERSGCTVAEAWDGPEAIERAQRQTFDLILMDLHMPGLDGFATCEAIRATAGPNRETPIWALSASALTEDKERCARAGMQGHLAKPIDWNALRDTLAAIRPPAVEEVPAAR